MKPLLSLLHASIGLLVLFTLLLGFLYPLVVTFVSQTLFSEQANGSLIERGDQVIGSSLIGQHFSQPRYFWGRPSATTPAYNASASAASNLSPNNPHLHARIQGRIALLREADPANTRPIPVDLITSSASGLDPHVSLEAIHYQLARVARERGVQEDALRSMVEKHTTLPAYGLLGGAYVNVLRLNLALDEETGELITGSDKPKAEKNSTSTVHKPK